MHAFKCQGLSWELLERTSGLSLRFSPQKSSPYSQKPRLTTLQTGFPNPEHLCSVWRKSHRTGLVPARRGQHTEAPCRAGDRCVNRKPGKTGPPQESTSQPELWQFVLGLKKEDREGTKHLKKPTKMSLLAQSLAPLTQSE